MPERDYICFNGDFLKAGDPILFSHFRSFIHGEPVTENIRAFATQPLFLNLHLDRLSDFMRGMSVDVPPFFTEANVRELINRLLNKNRVYGGAWIKLIVIALEEEKVASRGFTFLIDCLKIEDKKYSLNEKGLNIGLYRDNLKQAGCFAGWRKANTYLYHLAENERKYRRLDEIILLNQSGRIVETTQSNIFLVSGESIFTPGLAQGCVPGVMRKVMVAMAAGAGYNLNDSSSLTPTALVDAEEIFLTNTIEGIRWAGAFEQTRYFSKTAKVLTELLNKSTFG
jgi:branched-subunit amino acid aminotransferase/4-amino-4-deoxychorismate lyase